jgi:hypothetical protein
MDRKSPQEDSAYGASSLGSNTGGPIVGRAGSTKEGVQAHRAIGPVLGGPSLLQRTLVSEMSALCAVERGTDLGVGKLNGRRRH